MDPRLARLTALSIAGLLSLSTGLQPLLARVQHRASGESTPTENAVATEPPLAADGPESEEEQQQDESTFTGAGLSDMVDRHERSVKPSLLGAALADLPIQTPVSTAIHSRGLTARTDWRAVSYNWGLRAHWPCGPPAR
ncbi:MAG: hypothetical protein JSU68_15245 [Phycisphaerales bacterium]|nr:MAG: hypothetical protein JSU68_15245 [Phycisphaerales bacterium]